jgi:glycerol uptake facilitator-like aquaporin
MPSKSSNFTRQTTTKNNQDPERVDHDGGSVLSTRLTCGKPRPATQPFAYRIDGRLDYILERNDPKNTETLKHSNEAAPLGGWKTTKNDHDLERADYNGGGASSVPATSNSPKHLGNAAPHLSWKELLDLRGFLDGNLWRFAGIEAIGTMLLTFVSAWVASHPASPGSAPTSPSGVFGTPAFLGPLVGATTTWLLLTLLIYTFSATSGGHVNPMISIATFFARLITLPRMILYTGGQILGAALAGGALATAYGTTDFVVGGCNINPSLVSVNQAFAIEFMFSLTLIFAAFGVGLNPSQAPIFGAILSPWLIGMALGLLVFGSSFTIPGYEGAGKSSFFLVPYLVDTMGVITRNTKRKSNNDH